ncbi:MAG: filamentous hemagglutinin N-terminal domain-containing protein [Verrucomicrobiae bacterium]|nr:filamentous hemagglutinin N-terminal domain-containing protein [Verrucomicrobiae bacterium]
MIGAFCSGLHGQSVVPDGGTATTVTVDGAGKSTVHIAPGDAGGTSLNTYTRFNVSAAGVDLDNSTVGARTIVNQVTGTDPSILAGKLEVLGPRAHVIIANPQGILVNGGTFQNMGGLILSTGQRSSVPREIAPGVFQDNQVLNTSAGRIAIGADGLSGAFTHLELIARELSLDGPVVNSRSGANSSIRITAGESRAEVDVSVSPLNDTAVWAQVTPGTASSPGVILVEMSSRMAMSASRIQMAVTDAGAGVRHAGSIHATAGDFTLSSTGEIIVEGGSITAGRDMIASGTRLKVSRPGPAAPALVAGRHLDMQVDEVGWRGGGKIEAGDGTLGDITLGKLAANATGPMVLQGGAEALAVTARGGGIGLYAAGQDLDFADLQLTASQTLDLHGWNLTLQSLQETRGTFLTAGEVTPTLTGRAELTGARMISGTHLKLEVTGFSARNFGGRRSELVAAGGALGLGTTAGDILNQNSLIQGRQRNAADPASLGAVTLNAAGHVINLTDDARHQAIVFAEEDDLSITSGSGIENTAGRLISNRDVVFNAPGEFLNRILRRDAPNAGQIEEYSRSSGGFLFFTAKTRGWRLTYGDLALPGKLAYVIANGDVTINAGSVRNLGGEIDANDGAITIASVGRVESSAVISGSAWFEKGSGFLSRRSSGESSITINGGTMSASQSIMITAPGGFVSEGGELLAFERLRIDAPTIDIRSLKNYTLYSRKNGLRGIFGGGRKVKVLAFDQGGTLISLGETVELNAAGVVTVSGGVLSGANGVIAPGGVLYLRQPESESPVTMGEAFGFLGGFF